MTQTTATDLSGGVDPAKEWVVAHRPEVPEFRDACNIWLETTDYSLAMRLGIEAVTEQWDAHEIWVDIAYANGRVLTHRSHGQTHSPYDAQDRPSIRSAGPLRFQCVEPFKTWTVQYRGPASESSAQALIEQHFPENAEEHQVEIDLTLTMAVPPWVPGSMLKEAGEVLQGEQGTFMSPRYEQLFRATGRISVAGQSQSIDACGLRIRRTGVRKFAGFWGHCWQSAVFPSGKAFGFNIYPPRPDGQPNYAEGYVFDGSGVLKPARIIEVPWLRKLQTHGDDVSFVLETDQGRIAIEGETFINTRSRGSKVLPPDFPIVQQAHARYRWDGEETAGMVERSSTPDKFV